MQTNGEVVYLESSALVKLVLRESETAALIDFLANRPVRASCALGEVEVISQGVSGERCGVKLVTVRRGAIV